jgi:hypothetical protein
MITKIIRPLITDPVKTWMSLRAVRGDESGMLKGGGVHGQYIMPDKKISDVSKKGQDNAMASRLWDLRIGL